MMMYGLKLLDFLQKVGQIEIGRRTLLCPSARAQNLFWQGQSNQLNAKTVPRTVFCQKCFTLLNFVVQVLLLLYKKKRTPKKVFFLFGRGRRT